VQPNERTFALLMYMYVHRTGRPLDAVRAALQWARRARLAPHERLSAYIARPCEHALTMLSPEDGPSAHTQR
jgi:hypothetical protein